MTKGLKSAGGDANNKVKIGGLNELFGDPDIKIEKPYTIILFPGGSIELSRTTDGEYWFHVATHQDDPGKPMGEIVGARIDALTRYCDEGNKALKDEIEAGGVNHIAFRVRPRK